MTVAELIKVLQTLKQDRDIMVPSKEDPDHHSVQISEIILLKGDAYKICQSTSKKS